MWCALSLSLLVYQFYQCFSDTNVPMAERGTANNSSSYEQNRTTNINPTKTYVQNDDKPTLKLNELSSNVHMHPSVTFPNTKMK
ncbi:hypothetical protein V1520DRAFT_63597 [Lipomyces starkeyi]